MKESNIEQLNRVIRKAEGSVTLNVVRYHQEIELKVLL